MLQRMRKNKKTQLTIGFSIGILFGFLLQRGGVGEYGVILGQLLLTDFTVLKIMLTAAVVGMLLVYGSRSLGWVRLHPKQGSIGTSVVGGLIFGVGFAVLGLCPGTAAAAVGQGSLDALFAGIPGMLLGSWLFATFYPKLQKPVLTKVEFGSGTLPEALHVNVWWVVLPAAIVIAGAMLAMEAAGL
jgi:hypothetical protein